MMIRLSALFIESVIFFAVISFMRATSRLEHMTVGFTFLFILIKLMTILS